MSTEATITRHLTAIAAGVDEIVRDYTDDSIIFTPTGYHHGLDAIRTFFVNFLHSAPPELIQSIQITRQDIVGDVAYILWNAEPFIPFATDTFIVHDNKIAVQTFAMLPAQ